jgi:transposase
MLKDEFWSKLKEIMLQHGMYDKPNLRMVVEAMLYRMRVGCPWRDLPAEFGCWNSSQRNGTLYIGSRSDIIKRVWDHKNKVTPGFTAKYNAHTLVYYEMHDL